VTNISRRSTTPPTSRPIRMRRLEEFRIRLKRDSEEVIKLGKAYSSVHKSTLRSVRSKMSVYTPVFGHVRRYVLDPREDLFSLEEIDQITGWRHNHA
jgi:hypothetical protein